MLKKLLRPHSMIVTLIIFGFIWLLNSLRLNMHYLDPFNNGVKDYEITDIAYAYLSRQPQIIENQLVLVNCGHPNRAKIAALIDTLTAANVKVIGLDLFLEKVTANPVDTALQRSIRAAGNVVLACDLYEGNKNFDQFESWVGVDTFFANYATLGFANFPSNSTKTLRHFSPQERVDSHLFPAFATAIARQFDPAAVDRLLARDNPLERIFYLGDKSSFVRFEQDQILDSLSIDQVKPYLENKIVLIGYLEDDVWANPLTDRHYTPLNRDYVGKSIPDMYGIVVHANVISMILRNNYIKEVPKCLNNILALFFCFFNVLLIHWIYNTFHEAFHGITRLLQLLEFLLLFLIIALLFYYFSIRLEFSTGILALLLAYDIIMIYESLLRRRLPFLARIPDQIVLSHSKDKLPSSEAKNAEPAASNPELVVGVITPQPPAKSEIEDGNLPAPQQIDQEEDKKP